MDKIEEGDGHSEIGGDGMYRGVLGKRDVRGLRGVEA